MTDLDFGEQLRQWGDFLRAIATEGLRYAERDGNVYDAERYERFRRIGAEIFAAADVRSVDEIEAIVFRELTHIAPVPVVDAAVFDDDERILLIQRSDDKLWAMPGGKLEMGETPAEGALRETAEEAGVVVEPVGLVGVYDSRFCGSRSTLHLYQFVFRCRPVGAVTPTTPHEVLDVGWFAKADLPALSGGHTVRVADAFRYLRDGVTYFDA